MLKFETAFANHTLMLSQQILDKTQLVCTHLAEKKLNLFVHIWLHFYAKAWYVIENLTFFRKCLKFWLQSSGYPYERMCISTVKCISYTLNWLNDDCCKHNKLFPWYCTILYQIQYKKMLLDLLKLLDFSKYSSLKIYIKINTLLTLTFMGQHWYNISPSKVQHCKNNGPIKYRHRPKPNSGPI